MLLWMVAFVALIWLGWIHIGGRVKAQILQVQARGGSVSLGDLVECFTEAMRANHWLVAACALLVIPMGVFIVSAMLHEAGALDNVKVYTCRSQENLNDASLSLARRIDGNIDRGLSLTPETQSIELKTA